MAAGVNFLKLFDAHLGVDGGGVEFLVAEQLLDETDVRAVFQHVGGAGMTQRMATAFAFQPGLFEPGRDHARDHIGVERATVASQEQRLGAGVQAEPWTHFLLVTFEPCNGARTHGNHAIFFAFALANVQRAALGVQIGQIEAAKLGAAQAG